MSSSVNFMRASDEPPTVLPKPQTRYWIVNNYRIIFIDSNMRTNKQEASYPSNTSSFFCCSFRTFSSIVFSITNLTILNPQPKTKVSLSRKQSSERRVRFMDQPDWFILSDPVDSILCLPLHRGVPPWIHQENLKKSFGSQISPQRKWKEMDQR